MNEWRKTPRIYSRKTTDVSMYNPVSIGITCDHRNDPKLLTSSGWNPTLPPEISDYPNYQIVHNTRYQRTHTLTKILLHLKSNHCQFQQWSSTSTMRLRPLGLFLLPGNHLLISFVVFLFFFSLQVCLNFLGSLLSSVICICSLEFILYCFYFSLTLKIPNCSLMSLIHFLSESVRVYPAMKCIF